jgi:LacI family repressor for deo operon, udp, cdd, tsx, nupC, and nupG
VDGLIFARCTRREEGLVSQAREAQLPMVFVAPDENFAAGPVFVARNREAARSLTEHLITLGHSRFAFLGGPDKSVDALERLGGLRDALAERELELAAEDVQFGDSFPRQGAIAYAAQWQAMPRASAPTAVMCGNDTLAMEFLRAILQHGVRVPDEVSVVGFDGVPEGALYWPGLTTAKQPSQALGSAACRALMQIIENPEAGGPERIDLPAEVIVRESSGPARAAKKR